MATLLMPLPDGDFDPTESGVPWRTMRDHGHNVVFATPVGRTARADPKMVTGEGLGALTYPVSRIPPLTWSSVLDRKTIRRRF
jgi:hypothetical protein